MQPEHPANSATPSRPLTDYPRPSVAVDTAVLTVIDGALSVVLVQSGDRPALPGTFLHEGETLRDAVLRSLRVKCGISGLEPRQLHVFDALSRDTRGWVLSVAHVDVVPARDLTLDARLAHPTAVTSARTLPLMYDHAEIIDLAVEALRAEYADRPDPRALLPEPFTLRELQTLHEAIAGERLSRDAFRRRMEPQLTDTGELSRGTRGKPARLFRRTPDPRR